MTARKAPSDLDERVYGAIADYTAAHGFPPTLSEISEAVYLSKSGVARHLKALRRARRVTWEPGKPRTLRVLEERDL